MTFPPLFQRTAFRKTILSGIVAAWTFLIVGLSCTGLAYWQAKSAITLEQEAQLGVRADDAAHHFRKEVAVYVEMLKGVQSQWQAQPVTKPDVARATFRKLVAGLSANEGAGNIEAVGLARRGAGDGLPVQFLVPAQAGGFALQDIGADAGRRQAIERARDSGDVAMTNDARDIMLFLPIYKDDEDLATPQARRREFDGVVFLAIRTADLLTNAFGGELPDNVSLRVFHLEAGRAPAPGVRADGRLVRGKDIQLGGRTWRIEVAMDPAAMKGSERWLLTVVVVAGVVFSFVVFRFALRIERRRRAAVARARAAERTLGDKERDLDLITSMIDDVLWTISLTDAELRFVSAAAERVFGQSPASLMRDPSRWIACIHPADRRKVLKAGAEIRAAGAGIVKFRIVRPDGEIRWLRSKAYLIEGPDAASTMISGISTDVTDLQLAYGSLKRSHRALRALYQSERDVVVAASDSAVMQGVCDAIVAAGYRFAWIGLPDAGGGIVPAVAAGADHGYLQHVRRELGQGVSNAATVAAVQATLQPAVVNRFQSEATPLRRLALQSGLQAKVALPVVHSGELLGILNIYAAEEDAFDQQEIDFLSTLSYSAAVSLRAQRDRHALAAAEDLLRLRRRAIEACANPIAILRAQGPEFPIEYVNPAFERHAGRANAALVGQSMRRLIGHTGHRDGAANGRAIRAALDERREGRALLRVPRADGVAAWLDVSVTPVSNEQGEISHFIAVGYDVTAMVKYEDDLRRLAYHDVLTGLANRELMQRELAEAIVHGEERGQAVWLLMIDLDRFKYVNDTLGHHVGDHLLKIVSERLRATVRDTDIVARLGGDEFVIILRSPDSLDEGVVQRIMDHLSGPIELDGNDYVLTSSIGIAVYPRDGRDSDTLLKNADIAMYRAKNAGRNNFHFYEPEIPKVSMNRIRMEAALRTALEQGQFELHYQPQVDLATREIVGMEALLRWHHPDYGLIPPGDFLHIAEETGIIVAIGEWVMYTACRQTRAWQQAGLGQLRVAVNLSHRHFHRPELVDTVAECLRATGLAPACLDLELTEGIIMREVEHAIAKMDALKALGVQLSVDDFGTGYSSLAHLTRFPVDVLKVDRSFVQDIESDPQQAAITRSIISLARNLDLEVIAEGVENAAQLDYLVGYDCDQVQGYYFSRPVPARQFEALLREWKPALPMCA